MGKDFMCSRYCPEFVLHGAPELRDPFFEAWQGLAGFPHHTPHRSRGKQRQNQKERKRAPDYHVNAHLCGKLHIIAPAIRGTRISRPAAGELSRRTTMLKYGVPADSGPLEAPNATMRSRTFRW